MCRNCLGQQLAKINIPTAVAMLLREFHMELAPEVSHPPVLLSLSAAMSVACCPHCLAQAQVLWLLLQTPLFPFGPKERQYR